MELQQPKGLYRLLISSIHMYLGTYLHAVSVGGAQAFVGAEDQFQLAVSHSTVFPQMR